MPHHDSWVQVLYDFVMDPEIGPYARIKRKHRDAAARERRAADMKSCKNGNGVVQNGNGAVQNGNGELKSKSE